jgi:hypothetical protein
MKAGLLLVLSALRLRRLEKKKLYKKEKEEKRKTKVFKLISWLPVLSTMTHPHDTSHCVRF